MPNPLLRLSSIFLVALSLSIGWGIRGNFGHESGAMIAGVLSAIAVSVRSQRADWQRRVPYFALLGALGWGFGGSIAYMYPFAFTESGQTLTTYYGYFAILLEGGLWCGMGAAGTALAATMPWERLTKFFRPLCFVLAAMALKEPLEAWLEGLLATPETGLVDATWHRHESPLYWFDADWTAAVMALMGVFAFELVDRFRQPLARWIDHPLALLPFAVAGAGLGCVLQLVVRTTGLDATIRQTLVVKLGDLSYVNPETGQGYDPTQLLTNWPQFFSDFPQHLGWLIGMAAGILVYFAVTGKFRDDAKLFVYLAGGWLISFLALPVLGSIPLMAYGGLRVMPPRSDDWAGILGVFVAMILWSRRHDLKPVSHVMSIGFLLGGTAFAAVQMLRYVIRYPGHPWRYPEGVPENLAHYQAANWHSVMEQMHGFGHGIAIAFAMAMLWRRQPIRERPPMRAGWTDIFAATFALFVVGYLNLHKLVGTWVATKAIPETLKAPFIEVIELSPLAWFRIVWWAATAVAVLLQVRHWRGQRLEMLPGSWIGKGQLLYVLFLWLMVIGNLQRAIPGYSDNRMVTEWVLFMNACLATLLIGWLPRGPAIMGAAIADRADFPPPAEPTMRAVRAWPSLWLTWLGGLTVAGLLMCGFAYTTLALYQEHLEGHPRANHRRFGPDAKWRVEPILKHGTHP